MQSESSSRGGEELLTDDPVARILNLRVTHKRASLSALEAFSFADRKEAMRDIKALPGISESLVIETCNRVEVYAVARSADRSSAAAALENFWLLRNGVVDRGLSALVEKVWGLDSLLHLLRVASGLESMVVGEDQILGQIREAHKEGKLVGTVGPVLDLAVRHALQVGKSVRSSTAIDKGAVSVGSVAVELMRKSLGDLSDKRILIIGAGETGETVGKALALRKAGLVFVANRTYSRAVETAEALGATAIRFDSLENFLGSADAVVVATSAPHFLLTLPLMTRVMRERGGRGIVVVDISEPRNADAAIARLPGLTLLDLDDLHDLSRAGIEMRRREIREAEKIVQKSLGRLALMMKRGRAEPMVSALCQKGERIRQAEIAKALARMRSEVSTGSAAEEQTRGQIMEDFSRSLVDALLCDLIASIRRSSTADDAEGLLAAERMLGVHPGDAEEG